MGLSNRVRYFRFMRNELSQAELADKVSVSRQTIVAIEKGNYNPSVELALRLAKVLDTTVEELFVIEEVEA
ncbi:MAG: helix-turn-helix transcriptional regulator [Thermoanaerobaculaceae bacterium]|nr:helix-turn-helix transcriptional regulator [Thermoanaerobaculaceae bacterium]MDI9622257.1 helix-turn-helix transcriptional regulator [Acidobacteriota bacterium]NLH11875.1 helix-turn-helix transcriptional regulator [Holophagae bacterium]HPW56308.1 helix-turn-helix transcriptional regulator [Thermoanaerobaculaceae bacterium]